MTRRSRQVLAVLAVTTALCADQVSAAAPALRPQTASLTGRIVSRLTQSFGRAVADASRVQPRTRALARLADDRQPVTSAAVLAPTHQPLSPFQFRLPPPAL